MARTRSDPFSQLGVTASNTTVRSAVRDPPHSGPLTEVVLYTKDSVLSLLNIPLIIVVGMTIVMTGESAVNKLILLLLPLAFMHAQTPAAHPLARAIAPRRAPEGSARDASSPPVVIQRVIPRILSDGNWETTVVLLNTGSASVTFQQFFFATDGKPVSYAINTQAASGALTTSAMQGALAPGSSLWLTLSDTSGAVPEGWSLLTYNEGSGAVDGYAIIRRTGLSGGFNSETTVPFSSMQDYAVYMPFDNTLGFRSQVTLVNPAGNLSSQVWLTYMNPQGQTVLIDSLTLQPGQQMTLSLSDTYPDLANKSGSVLVEADIDVFSVTGLRCNAATGVIAGLPTMNRSNSLPD